MREENKKEILWHYTDFCAFDGILSNGEIWLGNVRNMNDAEEMLYFIDTVVKDGVKKKLIDSNRVDKFTDLEKIVKNQKQKRKNNVALAACFSSYEDEASQWDRYAKNGEGVSIGFNKELFEKVIDGKPLWIQKVSYEEKEDNNQFIENLYEYILTGKTIDFGDNIDELFNKIWTCSAAYKHPSFKLESETRLMTLPNVEENIEYKVFQKHIKKYYILKIKELCEEKNVKFTDLVEKIIIGPKSKQNYNVLREYLISKGLGELKDRISNSQCPLQ